MRPKRWRTDAPIIISPRKFSFVHLSLRSFISSSLQRIPLWMEISKGKSKRLAGGPWGPPESASLHLWRQRGIETPCPSRRTSGAPVSNSGRRKLLVQDSQPLPAAGTVLQSKPGWLLQPHPWWNQPGLLLAFLSSPVASSSPLKTLVLFLAIEFSSLPRRLMG